MVVFHGTNEDFTIFNKEKQNTKTGFGDFGAGFYFTASLNTAKYYTLKSEQNRKILSVFLNIKNPFIVELNWEKLSESSKSNYKNLKGFFDWQKDIIKNGLQDDYRPSKAITKAFGDYEFQDLLIRNAYDGVFVNRINIFENPDVNNVNQILYLNEIVAFEPNQIKLADGTNTTFDSSNLDIRYDDGGMMANSGMMENDVQMVSTKYLNSIRSQGESNWDYDLENSIEINGVKEPVIIGYWEEFGKVSLLDGHHRLDASMSLGINKIPAIIVNRYDYPYGKVKLYDSPIYIKNPKRPSDLNIFKNGGQLSNLKIGTILVDNDNLEYNFSN